MRWAPAADALGTRCRAAAPAGARVLRVRCGQGRAAGALLIRAVGARPWRAQNPSIPALPPFFQGDGAPLLSARPLPAPHRLLPPTPALPLPRPSLPGRRGAAAVCPGARHAHAGDRGDWRTGRVQRPQLSPGAAGVGVGRAVPRRRALAALQAFALRMTCWLAVHMQQWAHQCWHALSGGRGEGREQPMHLLLPAGRGPLPAWLVSIVANHRRTSQPGVGSLCGHRALLWVTLRLCSAVAARPLPRTAARATLRAFAPPAPACTTQAMDVTNGTMYTVDLNPVPRQDPVRHVTVQKSEPRAYPSLANLRLC